MSRIFTALSLLLLLIASEARANFNLPPLPPPDEYGNIILNRVATANGQQPVIFSHWLHRTKYSCRVCHGELEFTMKAGTSEITERANRQGKFCGACHNGRIAFRSNGNCERCHTGDRAFNSQGLNDFLLKVPLPPTMFGNGVDWSAGLRDRSIRPLTYLKKKPPQDMKFDKELLLEAEMSIIPPAIFPHKAHTPWLDCDNCHPDLFNIKKKGTHFSMVEILKGNYCGVCHLTVAFPMDDCKRCHPGMRE